MNSWVYKDLGMDVDMDIGIDTVRSGLNWFHLHPFLGYSLGQITNPSCTHFLSSTRYLAWIHTLQVSID